MDHAEAEQRRRVLAAARSWVGTPFHDLARLKGVGVDCAQLIIGVFAEAGLIDEFDTGYYSPQFFLHRGEERFLEFLLKHASEVSEDQACGADVVVFKVGRVFAHGGILSESGWPMIYHAHKQSGMVVCGEGDQGEFAGRKHRFFRYRGWR